MTREEAIIWIINLSADLGKVEHHNLWHYEQALDEIRELLEVDAVPVVRCKDCRHKYPYNNVWLCRFGIKIPGDDGYCLYGEKVTE